MPLIDYHNPYRELEDFRRTANRLFGFSNSERSSVPAVDVIENDEEFIFKADFPGFTKDEIEISAAADQLTIKAERTTEEEEKDEEINYIKRERTGVKFSRTFNFSKPVNPEGANVTLENGVLTITMPKSEEIKPKRLMISEGE